jgi:hypothetical protein
MLGIFPSSLLRETGQSKAVFAPDSQVHHLGMSVQALISYLQHRNKHGRSFPGSCSPLGFLIGENPACVSSVLVPLLGGPLWNQDPGYLLGLSPFVMDEVCPQGPNGTSVVPDHHGM